MVRPLRKKQIPNLQEAIKDEAWKQIATEGASALSLRAIARALNITAPAIYNYFPRRDDLVTALIVDAFTSLAEAQRTAIESLPANDLATRLATLGLAYRDWAVDHPQRYQLIFGTPIPGYEAPDEVTTPAAAEALIPLIETLQALFEAGKLRVEKLPKQTPALRSMLEAWREYVSQSGNDVNTEALYLAYVIWGHVHGMASLELGHQTPSFLDAGEVFRREIKMLLAIFIGEE